MLTSRDRKKVLMNLVLLGLIFQSVICEWTEDPRYVSRFESMVSSMTDSSWQEDFGCPDSYEIQQTFTKTTLTGSITFVLAKVDCLGFPLYIKLSDNRNGNPRYKFESLDTTEPHFLRKPMNIVAKITTTTTTSTTQTPVATKKKLRFDIPRVLAEATKVPETTTTTSATEVPDVTVPMLKVQTTTKPEQNRINLSELEWKIVQLKTSVTSAVYRDLARLIDQSWNTNCGDDYEVVIVYSSQSKPSYESEDKKLFAKGVKLECENEASVAYVIYFGNRLLNYSNTRPSYLPEAPEMTVTIAPRDPSINMDKIADNNLNEVAVDSPSNGWTLTESDMSEIISNTVKDTDALGHHCKSLAATKMNSFYMSASQEYIVEVNCEVRVPDGSNTNQQFYLWILASLGVSGDEEYVLMDFSQQPFDPVASLITGAMPEEQPLWWKYDMNPSIGQTAKWLLSYQRTVSKETNLENIVLNAIPNLPTSTLPNCDFKTLKISKAYTSIKDPGNMVFSLECTQQAPDIFYLSLHVANDPQPQFKGIMTRRPSKIDVSGIFGGWKDVEDDNLINTHLERMKDQIMPAMSNFNCANNGVRGMYKHVTPAGSEFIVQVACRAQNSLAGSPPVEVYLTYFLSHQPMPQVNEVTVEQPSYLGNPLTPQHGAWMRVEKGNMDVILTETYQLNEALSMYSCSQNYKVLKVYVKENDVSSSDSTTYLVQLECSADSAGGDSQAEVYFVQVRTFNLKWSKPVLTSLPSIYPPTDF